jgi:hypothetical protein
MATIAILLITSVGIGGFGGYAEKVLLPDVMPDPAKFLLDPSPNVPGVTKGFGLLLAIMFVYTFWLTMLGFSVGGKRKTFKELAKKDGEKMVEERYSLPNLYVEGNTKWAKAFNCVQRSHQQQLETLPQFFFCLAVAGPIFPLTSSLLALMSLLCRYVWAAGYSNMDADPAKRYDHPLSKYVWSALFGSYWMVFAAALSVAGVVSY